MSADFFGEDVENVNLGGEDPAVAEFLAREQAELAKIENNDFSNDDFGGFGNSGSVPQQQQNQFDSNAFGDDFGGQQQSVEEQVSAQNAIYAAIQQADRQANEPEKIRKWREEQRERLTKKDAEEEVKKNEWREAAKKELDDWYRQRQEQLEKTHANNKAAEAEIVSQRDAPPGSGQEWDRISKLCDFNPKANKNTKDVSRMRSLLLQLKQQPLVRSHN